MIPPHQKPCIMLHRWQLRQDKHYKYKTVTAEDRRSGQGTTYLQTIEGNAYLCNILYSKRHEDGNRDADCLVNGDAHEHFRRCHVTAHMDDGEEGEEEDEFDREKVGSQNQGL